MTCTGCGRANRAGARFCGGCGASLASRCPACGATHEPDAHFCDVCGSARAGAAAYLVEGACAEDLPKLARVELAANVLFEGTSVAAVVAGDVTALEEHVHARADGLLWVARAPDGEPVGFALVEILDGQPHLEELDVDPAHGRRGLGRALLGAVLDWARATGHAAVTLTTFRDIPWNAPFYQRMGFRTLAPHEIGAGLAEVMREEAARGLEPATRIAMRRDLDEAP